MNPSVSCWTVSSKPQLDEVLGAGVEPKDVASRRLGRADVAGPLAVVLDAPDVALGRSAP